MLTASSIFAAAIVMFPAHSPEGSADRARVLAAQTARIQTIRKLSPTVACVFNKGEQGGGGSGVIIDADGYGLTNFHVVAGMLKERKGDIGLAGGRLIEMEVLGIDPGGDVAMFRIDPKEVSETAILGDSDELTVGDYTLALGNPFGLADDYSPTVTHGIISGLHRFQPGVRGALTYTDCIQVDTSINPGNSGGPLFDMAGRLVGINGRISVEERSRVNVGVGFAITINQIKRFMPMLRAGIATPHAAAGFTVRDQALKVLVDEIENDSAARLAGLRRGDELIRFAGRDIRCANDYLNVLGALPANWPVEVVYRRGEEVRCFDVRLAAMPLPKLTRDAPGHPKPSFDPYGPHPVTSKANRRAVRRAIDLFQHATNSKRVIDELGGVHARGARVLTGAADGSADKVDWKVALDVSLTSDAPAIPDEIEARVWATLFRAKSRSDRDAFEVIASDEVRDRIAVVLEQEVADGPPRRLAFDDETGDLLAVEFKHEGTGLSFRYEYGEFKTAGALRMPHARWIYRGKDLFAEDRFEEVTVLRK